MWGGIVVTEHLMRVSIKAGKLILEQFPLSKLSLQKEPRFCFMETWFQTIYTYILTVIKQVKKLRFICKLSLEHPKREFKHALCLTLQPPFLVTAFA